MGFNMRLVLLLGGYTLLLMLACLQWLAGPSALAVMLSLAALLCAVLIWRYNRRLQYQTGLVLKALANQDTSLTLRGQSALQALLAQVQQQLSSSRQQAEARAQYLQTLLSQLDIAVLEFADNGQLLQANPATQRLLSAQQWQQLQIEINPLLEQLSADRPNKVPEPSLQMFWRSVQQLRGLLADADAEALHCFMAQQFRLDQNLIFNSVSTSGAAV